MNKDLQALNNRMLIIKAFKFLFLAWTLLICLGPFLWNSAQTGWSIAAKTPEKIEASLEFVKFMTNEESQRLILEMGGETPDCNVANADTFDLVVETINLAADCERSINDFQTLWHASVVDEISVQYPLLASGEITPEEFADALTAAAHR